MTPKRDRRSGRVTGDPRKIGLRTGTLKLITRHGRQPWYFKTHPELLKEAKKKYKVTDYFEEISLQHGIERAYRAWSSDKGKTIMFSWFR